MSPAQVRLGDVCTIGRGSSPRPIKDERYFSGGTIPWVKIADATASGKYIFETRMFVNEYGASFSRCLQPGSLIFPASGTLGIPRFLGVEACIHDGWLYFSDFNGVDPEYLYYKLIMLKDYYLSIAYGAAIQNINTDLVRDTKIALPDLADQRAIASCLCNYDDLIETNRRCITLLEESARLLYREWFVNLRFPGYEQAKVIDGLHVGWQSHSLAEVADFINGFAFKPAHLQEEGLPVVKIPELRDGVSDRTPRNQGDDIPERNKIDSGDLLFSWSATLIVNEWFDGPALLNQHLFKVIPKMESFKRYLRFALEAAIPSLLGQSVGATMQHIRKSALDDYNILVPNEELRILYAGIADPICDQAITLRRQIRLLIEARDELLPKLMSGAIQV